MKVGARCALLFALVAYCCSPPAAAQFFIPPPPPGPAPCTPGSDGVCRCDASLKGACICGGTASCDCANTGDCLCNNSTMCHCANTGNCYCGAAMTCSMETNVANAYCVKGIVAGSSSRCGGWSISGDMYCVDLPFNSSVAPTSDKLKCTITTPVPYLITLFIIMMLGIPVMVVLVCRARKRDNRVVDSEQQAKAEKLRAAISKPAGKGAGMEPLVFTKGLTYQDSMCSSKLKPDGTVKPQGCPPGLCAGFLFMALLAPIGVTFGLAGQRSYAIGFILIPLPFYVCFFACARCQTIRAGRGSITLTLDPARGELLVEQVDKELRWVRYSESLENFHHATVALTQRTYESSSRVYVHPIIAIERNDTSALFTAHMSNGLYLANTGQFSPDTTICTKINEFLSKYHQRPIDYEPKTLPRNPNELNHPLLDDSMRWTADHEPIDNNGNAVRWMTGVHAYELPKLRPELRPAYAQAGASSNADGVFAHREPPARPSSSAPPVYSEVDGPVKASEGAPGSAAPAPVAHSFCGKCGAKHDPALRFCSSCGFDVQSDQA